MSIPTEQQKRAYGAVGRRRKQVVANPYEGSTVNIAIRWLCLKGIKGRRNNVGAFKQEYTRKDGSKGSSWIRYGGKDEGDVLGRTPKYARYFEIECKRLGEKQTPGQLAHQREVEADGGIYVLMYTLDDLLARERELLGLAQWTPEGWR